MTPVIAIVGRPNVGKSTLFNRLTQTRSALVADRPGLTRDRQYGRCDYHEQSFIVIDTGGIIGDADPTEALMTQQVDFAVQEADAILFVVDGHKGLNSADQILADRLRASNKPIILVVNKIDGIDPNVATAEFYQFGFEKLLSISAEKNRGIKSLIETILEEFPEAAEEQQPDESEQGIKVAVIGRPNVGKSTLINRILGEERVLVLDEPGTTRDSIFIPFERRGQRYTLIDTAGVRRRGKITDLVEKYSVIKTMQALDQSHVVVFIFNAQDGITDQDLKLLGHVLDSGKALVIAVNKWDNLPNDEREYVKKEIDRRLVFLDYVKVHFISALHGTGVGNLFSSIHRAYTSAMKELPTSLLNKLLQQFVEAHQPPLVKGHRIKLKYAHAAGKNPPVIVIHGNQIPALPLSYKRYLESAFRKALHLVGTPMKIELRSGENPFADK